MSLDNSKELDVERCANSIGAGPYADGITSRILPGSLGVTATALPATLGVTSTALLRGALGLATTPVNCITSSKDRVANSSDLVQPWEAGYDRSDMEDGHIKHSEAGPKTPTKQHHTRAWPLNRTRSNSKSLEALRLQESLPEPPRSKPATPPRAENTKSATPTEQAYIDPQSAAIKELKDALTELRLIQANTRESSWDFFYKNIGTVASLGAAITFALIVTDIEDPRSVSRHGWIDLSTVRILLATSWILFMAVLSLSFSFAQKLKTDSYGPVLSHLVYVLELAAVLCLAFVVAAYVEVVGYVGRALVLCAVAAVLVQAVGQRPRLESEEEPKPLAGRQEIEEVEELLRRELGRSRSPGSLVKRGLSAISIFGSQV